MRSELDTLERLVPEQVDPADRAGRETLDLHLARYAFAARHVRPGRLLDLACGVGYGTRLLADANPSLELALGVDVAEAAIGHAREHYADERVRFRVGDAMTFHDPDGFDTIVSLETVEHLPDPWGFLDRLVALLRPAGILVASVPTTPSVDLNPHHRHDFTAAAFRRLGAERNLTERASFPQVQRIGLGALRERGRFRRENLRPNLLGYYAAHPGALGKRLVTTLRHGLANHYLTVVWQRSA